MEDKLLILLEVADALTAFAFIIASVILYLMGGVFRSLFAPLVFMVGVEIIVATVTLPFIVSDPEMFKVARTAGRAVELASIVWFMFSLVKVAKERTGEGR